MRTRARHGQRHTNVKKLLSRALFISIPFVSEGTAEASDGVACGFCPRPPKKRKWESSCLHFAASSAVRGHSESLPRDLLSLPGVLGSSLSSSFSRLRVFVGGKVTSWKNTEHLRTRTEVRSLNTRWDCIIGNKPSFTVFNHWGLGLFATSAGAT